jgi:hypothetical protein
MNHTYITELDEKQLDELMTYTPSYDQQNAENIRKMFLQKTAVKRRPLKQVLIAAAVIVMTLAFSLTALALTGVINFGAFFNSIFANPEAAPYVSTDEMITITTNGDEPLNESFAGFTESSNDILIEPIAGFIDGISLYLQLKLTSQNDNPIPDRLYIIDGTSIKNLGDVAISHIDEKTAIISFVTHILYDFNVGDDITIRFNAISSMPIKVENRPDNVPTEPPPQPVDSDDVTYVAPTENAITFLGDWTITVSTDSVIQPITVDSNFRGLSAEIYISATGIEVTIFADEDVPFDLDNVDSRLPMYSREDEVLIISLTDGRAVKPLLNAINMDYSMAAYGHSMEFINPADVVAIEFDGEILYSS